MADDSEGVLGAENQTAYERFFRRPLQQRQMEHLKETERLSSRIAALEAENKKLWDGDEARRSALRDLGMLAMQSERYTMDMEFRDAVDHALALAALDSTDEPTCECERPGIGPLHPTLCGYCGKRIKEKG